MSEIEVPEGWELKVIEKEIADFEKCNPEKTPDKEFKYVEISSVSNDKKIENFRTLLGRNAPSRARNVIRENDVIYGTTRPYYRNVVLIPKKFDNEICSTGFCVLRTKSIESKYLFYYMLSDLANHQILKPMRGGNYPAVSNKNVTSIKIPVPKKRETQKKIVLKLDQILEQLDEKKKEISNLKNNSILKSQILKNNYESILASSFLNYKNFLNNGKTRKIEELLLNKLQGFYYNQGYFDQGIPLLRITDMTDNGEIIYDTIPKIHASRKEYERYLLKKGDLVMARTGASRGRMVVFDRSDYDLIFAGYLIRFRFNENINPDFIRICFKHPMIKQKLLTTSHGGATKNINAENLKQISIPFIPISEQNAIEKKFNEGLRSMKPYVQQLENIIKNQEKTLFLIEQLNKSILENAFSGKLVN